MTYNRCAAETKVPGLLRRMKAALGGLRDLAYPKVCLSCGRRLPQDSGREFVCAACWDSIKKNAPPFCRRCGRQLKDNALAKDICPSCIRTPVHFDRAFSPCRYEGVIKELIHKFKYAGKEYLGGPLAGLMADFIQEYRLPLECVDYLVPVPLHKSKKREREFNQASVLAEHLSRKFEKPLLEDALMRRRYTKAQAELEGEARLANVKESFQVRALKALDGKNLLLIDDVLTTGATCSEAAHELKKAGARIVFVLTLAS